ncbi:MAG: cysteine desulfurase family protein [Myxococcota bacterium]|jgi:cysteine desulfurase|nr:cysteine desulfurase family protein [Myxococcota bacterium]
MSDLLYLDHNATTPVLPEAQAAMADALANCWGNPSSGHAAGRAARKVVDDARKTIAELVDADRGARVIFVSGATEGINQVIASAPAGRLVTTALEHPAVHAAAARRDDLTVELVAVEESGHVDALKLLDVVTAGEPPSLVCCMAANNETGVVQPIGELIRPLRALEIPLMVDASQMAGRLPLNFEAPDFLVLTAHKLGGPKGIGAVVIGEAMTLAPLIVGGGQEGDLRSGTEPVPAIAGFGAAARVVIDTRQEEASRLWSLREAMARHLLHLLPGSRVIGLGAPRLPNTLSFALPEGVSATAVKVALDAEEICVSSGSSCHEGQSAPSAVLTAMGIQADEALRVLRISMGRVNSAEDIKRFVERLPEVVAEASQ